MSDSAQICPKCRGELTESQTGVKSCPSCGIATAKEIMDAAVPSHASQTRFWITLILPATLALVSFLFSQFSSGFRALGLFVGIIATLVGLWASVYCAVWVVTRFCKHDAMRILLGLVLFVALALVNFIIIIAGCAGNLTKP